MIYIIRHGETIMNLQNRLQGASDTPDTNLTDKGRWQAEKTAERFRDIHFDRIYCSPLQRAVDTASYIMKGRDCELIFTDALIERGLGAWEGLSHEELRTKLNMTPEQWASGGIVYTEGETDEEFFERISTGFIQIVNDNIDKDILLVTHCIAIQVMMAVIKNEPVNKRRFASQASVTCARFDGDKYELLYEADDSHLYL